MRPSTPSRRLEVPRHVAIIMDGNGRWARSRGLERAAGHDEGARAVREVVRTCRERGVRYLTLYAFSQANWSRPKLEVESLMRLLIRFAENEAAELKEKRINVKVIGDLDDLPTLTRHAVEQLMAYTGDLGDESVEPAMTLSLALSYSGRRDVVEAMRAVAARARAGLLLPEDIEEASLRKYFTTHDLPDVDLLIRTGGEQRLSDFLLIESAYAELYFTDVLWPDFTSDDLLAAFDTFSGRERRFGRTGEQVRLAAVK
ncbi:MAG TPA: polyprenyl diphosphate synthase [Polyangiaceae bacterium]|nr:polyprenyl diphosphate synthase [Polyangiaceae bacterium]